MSAEEQSTGAQVEPLSKPVLWLYVIWKCISGVTIVVGVTATTAILGWEKMVPSEKAVAIIALVVAGVKSLDMLFDQTMRRVSQGKTPVPLNGNGHTQHFQKPAEPGK